MAKIKSEGTKAVSRCNFAHRKAAQFVGQAELIQMQLAAEKAERDTKAQTVKPETLARQQRKAERQEANKQKRNDKRALKKLKSLQKDS